MDFMEPFNWLPQELVYKILSFLPLEDMCRMRVLSKTWNSLLHSKELASILNYDPWFFIEVITKFKIEEYFQIPKESSREVWCIGMDRMWPCPLQLKPPWVDYYRFHSSSAGLILGSYYEDRKQVFFVGNPLGSWKKLPVFVPEPPLEFHKYRSGKIMVNPDLGSYVVIHLTQNDSTVAVYESDKGTWFVSVHEDYVHQLSTGCRHKVGFYKGKVYVVVHDRGPQSEYFIYELEITDERCVSGKKIASKIIASDTFVDSGEIEFVDRFVFVRVSALGKVVPPFAYDFETGKWLSVPNLNGLDYRYKGWFQPNLFTSP